jgi:opacity protein-like surface antigen
MKRYLAVAVATTLIAAAAAAHVTAQAKGWKERIDLSADATDPDPAGEVKFMEMSGGFHTVNPKAAIFWNPANTASGNYTLKATFAQNARSSHPNYLGLLFGGKDLDGANQNYTYFLVAPQNGTWILKQRTGDQTKDVLPRAKNAAIVQLDAAGKATNTLEVRVTADKVDFVVNGTVVGSSPKAGVVTDGIYGFRVNHALPDNTITDLSLTK